jgi:hypothetical protein
LGFKAGDLPLGEPCINTLIFQPMTPRILSFLRFPIDDELSEGLRKVKERDGITIAEQLRRGIQMWLRSRGVIKAERGAGGKRGRHS